MFWENYLVKNSTPSFPSLNYLIICREVCMKDLFSKLQSLLSYNKTWWRSFEFDCTIQMTGETKFIWFLKKWLSMYVCHYLILLSVQMERRRGIKIFCTCCMGYRRIDVQQTYKMKDRSSSVFSKHTRSDLVWLSCSSSRSFSSLSY